MSGSKASTKVRNWLRNGRGESANEKWLSYGSTLVSEDNEGSDAFRLGHADQITDELGVEGAAETAVGGDDHGKHIILGAFFGGAVGHLLQDVLHVQEEASLFVCLLGGSEQLSLSDELHSTGDLFDGTDGRTTQTHYNSPSKWQG